MAFLPTSPVWGTTTSTGFAFALPENISTHVPRMGDDFQHRGHFRCKVTISTHVPRMGDDVRVIRRYLAAMEFLPTSPVWGTTPVPRRCMCKQNYFYPRPPYGGRQHKVLLTMRQLFISTHVPRMGDDTCFDFRGAM